jgi:NitT/TauT family transport system ATP-binding protein
MTEKILAAFVPLVDCAVLVAAREGGFAAAEGLELDLVREPSWASLRDHLALGHVDCAHALAPLPVALRLGVGYMQVECSVPFVLSRGGNAITLATSLFEQMQTHAGPLAFADGPMAAARALAVVARQRSAPLTLGVVFPFSNHNFDLRYWLAAAGLHPDRDVRLVAIPPPLMVEALGLGLVDGFCVGEPWNTLAVTRGLGCIAATQSQLFPHSVEKVLAVSGAFEAKVDRMVRLLRALRAAAAWADDPANHAALAALLALPNYLGVAAELVEAALRGRLSLGGGRVASDPDFLYFYRNAANRPEAIHGHWAYAQMVRWGQVAPSAAAEAAAARGFREDIYERCLPGSAPAELVRPAFDGIAFSNANLADYARQFAIATPHTATGAES